MRYIDVLAQTSRIAFILLFFFNSTVLAFAQERRPQSWEEICIAQKKAVVQILTCSNHYNFFEPFRSPAQSQNCGSGVFISSDGYLLTNFHVISDGAKWYARLSQLCGEEKFELEHIGSCPQRDVSLLRLTPESLESYRTLTKLNDTPFALLGDSDAVVEAQSVMLLGHPHGEKDVKVSIGYVKGRTAEGARIQTTTPANLGDSGGPYFDTNGKVIGLCVSKQVGNEVDCFTYIIPINSIKLIFDDLAKRPILRLPMLGIDCIPTTKSTRAYLECPEEGIYVKEISSGMLLDKAGLKAGDIITAVDNHKLDDTGYLFADWTESKVTLSEYINRIPIGNNMEFTYYRNGKAKGITVKAEAREVMPVDFFYPGFEELPKYEIFAGMVVSQLTANHILRMNKYHVPLEEGLIKYLKDDTNVEPKLLITSILDTSKLHLSEAFAHDIHLLKKINNERVTTINEFRKAVLAGKNKEFLTIESDSGVFVALPLKEILEEEDRLSKQYYYAISDLVEKLKE